MEGRRTHHPDPRGLGWCGPTSPFHPTTPAEVRSLTSLAHDCLAVQLFRHMAPGLSTLAVACSRLPFCFLLRPSHSACLRPSRCGPVTGGSCLHDVLSLFPHQDHAMHHQHRIHAFPRPLHHCMSTLCPHWATTLWTAQSVPFFGPNSVRTVKATGCASFLVKSFGSHFSFLAQSLRSEPSRIRSFAFTHSLALALEGHPQLRSSPLHNSWFRVLRLVPGGALITAATLPHPRRSSAAPLR